MKRVEFKLSMPGRNSWNGRWSGEERNYTIVKSLRDSVALDLLGERGSQSWSYAWKDGWCANVRARIVMPGERLKKSDGFCGYDWMIDSILQYGRIYASHERPEAVSS